MRIRNLTSADSERVYDAFRSVSVDRNQQSIPKSGFFEYPLSLDDIRSRLQDNRFSLVLEEGGNILSYMIAYQMREARSISHTDPVLSALEGEGDLVYGDQLFLSPGTPIFYAGRLADFWTTLVANSNSPGVVCAIPQKPWKNLASTRMALARGFSRQGRVLDGDIELGLFSKPIWTSNEELARHYYLKVSSGKN